MHPSGWMLGMSCRPRHPLFDPLLGVPWITWYMVLIDGGLLLGVGPKGPTWWVSTSSRKKKKNSIAVINSNVVLKSYHDIHFGNFKCLQHFFKNIYQTNQSILNVHGCFYKSYIKQYYSKNATAALYGISFKQLSQSYNIMKLALLGLHYVPTTYQQRRDDMDRYCFKNLKFA